MTIRQHTRKRDAGYTLIELLEIIGAICLGAWLADIIGSHFEGVWHTIVYWTIATVGSGVFFLCFLFGFGYLMNYERRRKIPKPTYDDDKPNAA